MLSEFENIGNEVPSGYARIAASCEIKAFSERGFQGMHIYPRGRWRRMALIPDWAHWLYECYRSAVDYGVQSRSTVEAEECDWRAAFDRACADHEYGMALATVWELAAIRERAGVLYEMLPKKALRVRKAEST